MRDINQINPIYQINQGNQGNQVNQMNQINESNQLQRKQASIVHKENDSGDELYVQNIQLEEIKQCEQLEVVYTPNAHDELDNGHLHLALQSVSSYDKSMGNTNDKSNKNNKNNNRNNNVGNINSNNDENDTNDNDDENVQDSGKDDNDNNKENNTNDDDGAYCVTDMMLFMKAMKFKFQIQHNHIE